MSPLVWWQLTLTVIKLLVLVLIGYGEYRLWVGTASPTARGLSVLFATSMAWGVMRAFLW